MAMADLDPRIAELIKRRENQILLHACLYYEFNLNLISDDKYDQWSFELKDLIDNHPVEFKQSPYYKDFKGFVPDSGYYLPYKKKYRRAMWFKKMYEKELKAKKKQKGLEDH